MRYLTLILCLLAAPLAAAPPRKPHPAAGLAIASIKIETHNVFDTDVPPENKLVYKAANYVHIKTFDPVIERELLFDVGDIYDPALIEETERNLRTLGFIRRAEISATINKQGTVDVIVRTYDSWTLEIVANFKRAGGSTSIKAGLAEHNVLGQGKSVSAVYSRDGGAESKSFAYKDVQFLHYKRLQYSMVALTAPGNQNFSVSLNRPFYASIAPRAAGGTVSYASTAVGAGVSRRVGEAGANYGIAFATSTERTRRVNFGLLTHRAQSNGQVPDLEQLTFLKLGAEWQELDFLTVRRIQNFTHDEDYNLGLGIVPTVAWAPKLSALGTTQAQIIPRIDVTKGFTWSNQLVLLKSGLTSKYVNGANGNRIASVDAAYFLRALRFQTLAFHAGLDLGWRLDSANQLVLGEINGLRGYGLSEFSGERRFLFNIEDRIYVYDDLFRLLDIGAVAFFDSGYVWPAATVVRAADLKNSVGLGLRVAPSRSGSNSPVRIDVAFPLSHHSSRSMWSLSILAGQAF
ncbi:MAG: hypothetical protein PHS14_17160 [Elusimicrobia bacterium]|nr:hypothetical protein [Elusimicrobiota bacterium]